MAKSGFFTPILAKHTPELQLSIPFRAAFFCIDNRAAREENLDAS
jgi:hypothetical protein